MPQGPGKSQKKEPLPVRLPLLRATFGGAVAQYAGIMGC